MNLKWKELIVSIAISLGVGALAGYLIRGSVALYSDLIKPPLSPPSFIFPIVWTILYVLMGISAYMIYVSGSEDVKEALKVYGLQLFLNFLWSLVFFNMQAYLLAFIILCLLLFTIYIMIERFGAINLTAAKLQIPYLLWVMFAGYLNLAIVFLNK
ncbi:MAG: TspO/MBR family protein [Lachnotalea sp.]